MIPDKEEKKPETRHPSAFHKKQQAKDLDCENSLGNQKNATKDAGATRNKAPQVDPNNGAEGRSLG
jgi:hypothetical protein